MEILLKYLFHRLPTKIFSISIEEFADLWRCTIEECTERPIDFVKIERN